MLCSTFPPFYDLVYVMRLTVCPDSSCLCCGLILCVLRDGYHSEQTVPTFGEQVVAMEAKAKTHRGAHAVKS